jgi:hypothetical protein
MYTVNVARSFTPTAGPQRADALKKCKKKANLLPV